ncbi:MAG: LLM class flavin-dependent oxidoreductase [Polyangiales bacterium]
MMRISVLDLSPITAGSDAATALRNTLDLARHAERLGFTRFWLAEHHGMPGVASAATAVVIAHVAAGTERIRIGAGGIMLPNHAPLVIAEQFGTLASLHRGRIDLGLGRARGSDPIPPRALRRTGVESESFPEDVLELMAWFEPAQPGQRVMAVPGAGVEVPLWILGSSLFGAELAARLSLPYAFASHFAPAQLMDALALYRAHFQPSEQQPKPYAMPGLQVVAAETDDEARRLFTSVQQAFLQLRRGRPGPLPPPVDALPLTREDQAMLDHALSCAVVGSPETVARGLAAFRARTGADELMISSPVFDHAARLRSFAMIAAAAAEA